MCLNKANHYNIATHIKTMHFANLGLCLVFIFTLAILNDTIDYAVSAPFAHMTFLCHFGLFFAVI